MSSMSRKLRKPILVDSTNTYRNPQLCFEPIETSKIYFEPSFSRAESKSSNYSIETGIEDSTPTSSSGPLTPLIFNQEYSDPIDPSDEQYMILNSALNQKKKTVTDETKYKTELCKNWSETGQCPYGKKCKFAHGRHELNEKKMVNKNRYKSKKCNSFHTQTNCPYGVRCLFAHEQRNLEEINMINYYDKYIMFPTLLENPLTRKNKRLPFFVVNSTDESSKGFVLNQTVIDDEFKLWDSAFECNGYFSLKA